MSLSIIFTRNNRVWQWDKVINRIWDVYRKSEESEGAGEETEIKHKEEKKTKGTGRANKTETKGYFEPDQSDQS